MDHWAVLGLEPGADAESLKQAFRRQARRWHPDLNGNDPAAEERFKKINEAYEVLSDPRRRQAWEAGGVSEAGHRDPFASGFPDFHDYVDQLFSRRRERRPATTPPPPPPPVQAHDDLETAVPLTPEQALDGTYVEVELSDGTTVEVQTPPEAGDG